MIKKIILLILLIIFIPYVVVNLFIKDEEIKFNYVSNMVVRVKRESSGRIDKVPFEEYVTGVLAGEMPITFSMEALKAQAVAARTYVMKKMAYNKDKEYDVVDTVANQVYLDDEHLRTVWKEEYQTKINKIKMAVMATKGGYLAYDGKVADIFYFSTSVGKTENSEDVFNIKLPYLRSVDSKWDKEVSPVFNDYFYFTLDEFYKKLNIPYQDKIKVEILKTTSTGRIKELKINSKKFTSSEVFSALNLRSTYFEIIQNGNEVKIITTGYGHGVGMSQYGAEGMARAGYTYDQILKHYYQGIEIKKI
ncbi:MAG: stage II sporulation protein D [Mollicutes bacterium]|nr:stage II sporulation protein D [Mollicutes bacterium]